MPVTWMLSCGFTVYRNRAPRSLAGYHLNFWNPKTREPAIFVVIVADDARPDNAQFTIFSFEIGATVDFFNRQVLSGVVA